MSYGDIEEQRNTLADLIEQQTEVLVALDMTDWADAAREVKERLLSDNFKALLHYETSEDGTASPPKEVPAGELENYVVSDYLNNKEERRKNPYDHVEL